MDTAAYVAKRVVDTLRAPIALGDHTLTVSASVGMALCDGGRHRGAEGLLRAADAAMYEVKAGGGSGYALFQEAARGAMGGAGRR